MFNKPVLVCTAVVCFLFPIFFVSSPFLVCPKSPLGLCVVTMTFPKDWFEPDQAIHQHHGTQTFRQRHPHRVRARNHSRKQQNLPAALRAKPGTVTEMIQLYYSSFSTMTNLGISPPRCVEDKLPQLQRELHYIGPVTLEDKATKHNKTQQGFSCLNELEAEVLWLDSNVLIRYNKGPVLAGRPVGISINLRSNFSGESVVVRYDIVTIRNYASVMLQTFSHFCDSVCFCSDSKWRKAYCPSKPNLPWTHICGLIKWKGHQAPNMKPFL